MSFETTGPELWAGVECTFNRVGDQFIDQCEKSGHCARPADLEMFAELGVRKIRQACLWEKAADGDGFNWSLHDGSLNELRRLGLTPIAGFLHHGSGPASTDLLDPEFPYKLANYARAFAERYPWVEDYTPVNEPLTTARFSALYGVWYPHARDDRSFVRALWNQVLGTVLAMREIRKINPRARLVQTEDLGRAQSTEPLVEQCVFENERRWLTFDLLCGRVKAGHFMYRFLSENGIKDREFEELAQSPCPPNILGLNHYLLSNRYLDHRLELYPEVFHGGNGRQAYADVGAVDTGQVRPPSPGFLFWETWQRYRMPMAVTEVHIRGHREDQMRWFWYIWREALRTRTRGADLRAVTAWSLLGTYDWNSLCTKCDNFYEPGIFDSRAEKPRPTALAQMVRSLARESTYTHPLLEQPGWWETPARIRYAPKPQQLVLYKTQKSSAPPILITGARGTLGRAFARICEERGIPCRILQRSEMDIADPVSVRRALHSIQPWAVINTAGYVKVDQAEREIELCYRENVEGPLQLAEACAERNLGLLTFSSDLVFDGILDEPYTESHPVSPLNVYGRSKAESERLVLESHPEALVIRTSAFFGPWDEANFLTQALQRMARRLEVHAASDIQVSPTYVPDLVHACLDLLIDGEHGLLHLANDGCVSWADLARMAAALSQHATISTDPALVVAKSAKELGYSARRPRQSALRSERVRILPALEDAIHRYFSQLEIKFYKSAHSNHQIGGHP